MKAKFDIKNKDKKVFVALSGGVDSAVSAALLVQQGFDVTGVYMKNWSGDDFGIQADCPWEVDQKDAEAVCKHLGIPFRSFNFEREYREKVVEYFFDEYSKGRTPNPDVMCNKEIKFKLFLDKATAEGAELIATGHYAQVEEIDGIYRLIAGRDDVKNQVYFLYTLDQVQLSKILFPVGGMEKKQVRELAKEFGLPNKNKPDSQGICFIGEINVLQFLMSGIEKKIGDIVDIETGKIVGQHNGIYFYTIGQRKGIGIGGVDKPYFVCGKNSETNVLYVCSGRDSKFLLTKSVVLENLHLTYNYTTTQILDPEFALPNSISNRLIENEYIEIKNLSAVIRYQQKPEMGTLRVYNSGEVEFIFDSNQWAVASGQSLVIFSNTECIGGGVIG